MLLIGVVAGDDRVGPSRLCPGVGKADGGPGVKSVERSVLRQSRGIVKMKTMKDVSRLSLRCRVNVSVTRGVNVSVTRGMNIQQGYMSKLRSGRSFSSDNLEIPEVVDLVDQEDVSKARRGYTSSKFHFFGSYLLLFQLKLFSTAGSRRRECVRGRPA